MPSEHDLERRIEELEANLRVLQAENAVLTEGAEDTMLLGLIAEEISAAQTVGGVIESGLERLSIVKDIPLCACCQRDEDVVEVVESFLSCCSEDLGKVRVTIAPAVLRDLTVESVYLHGSDCSQVELPIPAAAEPLTPTSMLLMPMRRHSGPSNLFIFADSRPEERLPSMVPMLHRVTEMMTARVDNIRLLSELTTLNVELERATRAKTEFLANMSHEIRTPMNAILGFAQLLRHDLALTPEQAGRLDIISRNGEYLLDLINDILEMSKIEAGRSTVDISAFDLHATLDDIDGVFRGRMENKRLAFRVQRDADLPHIVLTDVRKVRQILVNLLANAAKFTNTGSVTLRASARRLGGTDLELRFDVEDTGVGIEAGEMSLLFGQFGQTRSGRASGSGSGLGLAISREYARLLGGDIKASSRPGAGSTFTVTLPAQLGGLGDLPPEPEERTVIGLLPGQPRYRVLVADDFAEMRDLISEIMSRVGFDVRTVADGSMAVEEFSRWRPDLVLMDLRMPVMDGHEAIRLIRNSGAASAATKIVALTASTFTDARTEVLASGADGFLGKPCTEAELFRTAAELLGAKYVYDDSAGPEPTAPAEAMHSDMFEGIPESLLSEIRDATSKADFRRVVDLCDQLAEVNAVVARGVRRLALDYDAETILRLLTP